MIYKRITKRFPSLSEMLLSGMVVATGVGLLGSCDKGIKLSDEFKTNVPKNIKNIKDYSLEECNKKKDEVVKRYKEDKIKKLFLEEKFPSIDNKTLSLINGVSKENYKKEMYNHIKFIQNSPIIEELISEENMKSGSSNAHQGFGLAVMQHVFKVLNKIYQIQNSSVVDIDNTINTSFSEALNELDLNFKVPKIPHNKSVGSQEIKNALYDQSKKSKIDNDAVSGDFFCVENMSFGDSSNSSNNGNILMIEKDYLYKHIESQFKMTNVFIKKKESKQIIDKIINKIVNDDFLNGLVENAYIGQLEENSTNVKIKVKVTNAHLLNIKDGIGTIKKFMETALGEEREIGEFTKDRKGCFDLEKIQTKLKEFQTKLNQRISDIKNYDYDSVVQKIQAEGEAKNKEIEESIQEIGDYEKKLIDLIKNTDKLINAVPELAAAAS